MTLSELKARLIESIEAVCSHLLPGGRKEGNYWRSGGIQGGKGGSLGVCLSGPKTGLWIEGDPTAGDKGDVIHLWKACRGVDTRVAIEEIRGYLNAPLPDACKATVKTYTKPKPKLKELAGKSKAYLRDRGISWAVASGAGCAEAERSDPAIAFQYFKQGGDSPVLVKFLSHSLNDKGKKIIVCIPDGEPCLFGMSSPVVLNHSGVIVITEGEVDALSWLEIGVPAVSIPLGAKAASNGASPNEEWVANSYEFLLQFETIIINMDDDEPGHKAEADIIKIIGIDRCKSLRLSGFKDANEALMKKGLTKELLKSAKTVEPAHIMPFNESLDEGWDTDTIRPEMTGHQLLNWPIEFRIRPRETTAVIGYDGSGKTNFMAQVMSWLAFEKREKVFVASYENGPVDFRRKMIQHAIGRKYSSKEKYLLEAVKMAADRSVFFHRYRGEAKYEEFFESASHCVKRFGVTQVLLDCVTSTNVDLDDLKSCDKFMKAAQRFVNDNPYAHLWLIFHPKKNEKGENYPPLKEQIRGSSVFSNLIWNVITVFRKPEGHAQSWDARIIISKQREGGARPEICVHYDQDTYRLHYDWSKEGPYIKTSQSTEGTNDPF